MLFLSLTQSVHKSDGRVTSFPTRIFCFSLSCEQVACFFSLVGLNTPLFHRTAECAWIRAHVFGSLRPYGLFMIGKKIAWYKPPFHTNRLRTNYTHYSLPSNYETTHTNLACVTLPRFSFHVSPTQPMSRVKNSVTVVVAGGENG